jgi:F-type H+-transporting ATPase subunit epsilon
MDKTFHLTVVTPQRVVFEGAVQAIVAPGGDGHLGILARHAPLITTIAPGLLSITLPQGYMQLRVGAGFLDVLQNEATLLSDTAEIVRITR